VGCVGDAEEIRVGLATWRRRVFVALGLTGRWGQCFPRKCWGSPTRLHGVGQRTTVCILTCCKPQPSHDVWYLWLWHNILFWVWGLFVHCIIFNETLRSGSRLCFRFEVNESA
jgi:hypothetical protein